MLTAELEPDMALYGDAKMPSVSSSSGVVGSACGELEESAGDALAMLARKGKRETSDDTGQIGKDTRTAATSAR